MISKIMDLLKNREMDVGAAFVRNTSRLDPLRPIQDEEQIRLLKLQEEFSKGNINEEDMDEYDVESLYELYGEQIEKIKENIEKYKFETMEAMKELKKLEELE